MLNKGKEFNQSKKFDEAIKVLTSALDTDPSNAELYQELGWSYYRKKDYQNAKENAIKAIGLNPGMPIPYVTLAEIKMMQKKDYGEGYALAEKAYNLDPSLDLAVATYGSASLLVGKNEQGVTLLERARDISPEKSFIRNNLAFAYSLAKQHKLAFQEFQMAYRLTPSWHARHMVFSSYLAQFKFFQNVEHYSWVITIGFFIWVMVALAWHSVFLLLVPTIYCLLLTIICIYTLIKSGLNWRYLGGAIFGAVFSGSLIYLISLIAK
jgi:tetratricopeptide (TPR) repeat protein